MMTPPLKPPGRGSRAVASLGNLPLERVLAIRAIRRHGGSLRTLAAATGLTMARIDAVCEGKSSAELHAEHEARKAAGRVRCDAD